LKGINRRSLRRITFEFSHGHAEQVDFEQYH
jgi:hypothetical protein